MATTSDSPMKFIESANCAICGRQVWIGIPESSFHRRNSHLEYVMCVEHLGGTLEQDETGALRSSKLHQYQTHICKAEFKNTPAMDQFKDPQRPRSATQAKIAELEIANTISNRRVERLTKGLSLAATRLEICADRMRGCHADTGKHELLDEVEMFVAEAREAAFKEEPDSVD